MPKKKKTKDWFKPKGYLHFTPKLERKDRARVLRLLQNKSYIARHAFYPLMFYEIVECRKKKKTKKRSIAYATHLDTQIFSYYADELNKKYEKRLKSNPQLDRAITAYRKIEDKNGKGKRNIHFAQEAFQLIKKWGDCTVLTFDVKSFFPTIDHILLKKIWADLLGDRSLPPDHYNLYKAVTNFSYIRKEELKTHKNGFDEARLAELRKKGIEAFFESGADFREKVVQNPNIRIYKNKVKKDGRFVGLPQGLPITPLLANAYMYEFDKQVITELVETGLCEYRRYSDDILVVCKEENTERVKKRIREILKKKTRLKLSDNKTEQFICKVENGRQTILNKDDGKDYLTYLGFDYYGYKTLIKSATLAKYYRRMKQAIRTKVRRMEKTRLKRLLPSPVLYRRKLYRNYTHIGSKPRNTKVPSYEWEEIADDEFIAKRTMRPKRHWGNFIHYANNAAEIMNEKLIKRQVRKHRKHFDAYLKKQLEKYGF